MPNVMLAELLCSRLCHDLIGPITAISHGIEILGDDDAAMRQQALDLMLKSAAQGVARLQFYRLAFGQAAGAGEVIPRAEVMALVAGLLQGGKVRATWAPGAGDPTRRAARLFLNLIHIGADALIRGGSLHIEIGVGAAGETCRVAGDGPVARVSEEARAAVAGTVDRDSLDARLIQAHYTRVLANELGAQVMLTVTPPGTVALLATVPPALA